MQRAILQYWFACRTHHIKAHLELWAHRLLSNAMLPMSSNHSANCVAEWSSGFIQKVEKKYVLSERTRLAKVRSSLIGLRSSSLRWGSLWIHILMETQIQILCVSTRTWIHNDPHLKELDFTSVHSLWGLNQQNGIAEARTWVFWFCLYRDMKLTLNSNECRVFSSSNKQQQTFHCHLQQPSPVHQYLLWP